jgi:hypothetical protein
MLVPSQSDKQTYAFSYPAIKLVVSICHYLIARMYISHANYGLNPHIIEHLQNIM